MRIAEAVLIALLAAGAAAAQEYEFYGDAAVISAASWMKEPAGEPVWETADGWWKLTGSHALTFDWGELSARHRLTAESAGAGNYEWEHQVFQAAAAFWPGPNWTVTLGRQTLAWGRGYAFFPSDALHPERSPEGDAPGFDGGSVTWTVTPDWSVSAALRTDRAFQAEDNWWERLRGGGVLSGYAAGIDAMASVVYERNRLLRGGAGSSADLWGTILTCEGALEFLPAEGPLYPRESGGGGPELKTRPAGEPVPAVTAGLERTVYPGNHALTFLAEYFYTKAGLDRKEAELFFGQPAAMVSLYGNPEWNSERKPEFLGQHYLYPRFVWDWDQRLTWENTALVNLQDGSGRAGHSLTWSNGQALELILQGSWYWGEPGKTEMGLAPERGRVEALVKVYF